MINNIKTGSGNRLKEIRKTLDLSQKELASILNISVGHMCDLEHSKKNITKKNIILLTLLLDINKKWLKSGVGEMFIKKDINTSILDMATNIIKKNDSNFKKQLLYRLSKLNNESWEALEILFNVNKTPID